MTDNFTQNNVSCMNFSPNENTNENQSSSVVEISGVNGDIESHCENIHDRGISCDPVNVINIKNEVGNSEDIFYQNVPSTGIAPTIPTSSQYGLVLMPNNEVGDNVNLELDEKTDDTNCSVPEAVSSNIKNTENTKTVCTPVVGSDRFKVVKIESTQPFKRGRWVCMDFSDQAVSKHSERFQAIVNGDVQENLSSSIGSGELLNKCDNGKSNDTSSVPLESFHSAVSNSQNNAMSVNGGEHGLNNSSPEQSVDFPVKSEGNGSQYQAQSLTQASSVQFDSSNPYSQSQSLPPQQLQQLLNTKAHVQTVPHVTPGSQHSLSQCQQESVKQMSPHHLHPPHQLDQSQTVPLKQVPASEQLLQPLSNSSTFQQKLPTQESSQLPTLLQQQNMVPQQLDTPQQTFQQVQGQNFVHSQNISLSQQPSMDRNNVQSQGSVSSLQGPAQNHPTDHQLVQPPSYSQQPHMHHQQQVYQQQPLQQNQTPQQSVVQQQQSSTLPQGQQSQMLQSQIQQQQMTSQLSQQQRIPPQQSQMQVQPQHSQIMQNQIQTQISQQTHHIQQQVQAQHQTLQQSIQTHQPQISHSPPITQQIQNQVQQTLQQTQPHLQQVQVQQSQLKTNQPVSLQVPVSQQQTQMHQQQPQTLQQQQRIDIQAQQHPLQQQQQTQYHMQTQQQPMLHQAQSQIPQCQISHQSQAQTPQGQGQIHQLSTPLQNPSNLLPQMKPLIQTQPPQQSQSSQLTQLQPPSQAQQSSQVQQLPPAQPTQMSSTVHQCQTKSDQPQMHQQQSAVQSQSSLYANSQIGQGQVHHSQSMQDPQPIKMQSSQSQQFSQQGVPNQQMFSNQQQPQPHLPRQQNQHILSHQMSVQAPQQSSSLLHQQSVEHQPLQMHILHSQIQQPQTSQHSFDTHASAQHTIGSISHESQQVQTQTVSQSLPNLQQQFMSHQLNVQSTSNQSQTLQQPKNLPSVQQYQTQPMMMQNPSQANQAQNIPVSVQQSFTQSVGVNVPPVSQSSQNHYTLSQDGILHQTQFVTNEPQQIQYNVGQASYSGQNIINASTPAPASLQQPLNIPQQNFFCQTDGSSLVSNISIQPHQLTNQSQGMCDNQNQFSSTNLIHCKHSSLNQNVGSISSQAALMDSIPESQQQNVNSSQFVTTAPFNASNQSVNQQNYSVVQQSQQHSDNYVQTFPSGAGITNVISNSSVSQNATPVSEYNPDIHSDASGAIYHGQQYSHMYANGSLTGSHQSYQSSIDSNITTCDRASIQSHFYPKRDETHLEDNISHVSDDAESASGSNGNNTVAIDNKIGQAMDLVKSHLMIAVREEVEVLKEKIDELMNKITQLEIENSILKANATPEILAQLPSTVVTPQSTVMHASTSTETQQPP